MDARTWTRRLMIAAIGLVALVALPASASAKTIVGTKHADRVMGTSKADTIKLKGGSDRAKARGGEDRVIGGGGKDRLNGGKAADKLRGGKGKDKLIAADGAVDTKVDGGPGADVCKIDQVDLPVVVSCAEVVVVDGGGGGDELTVTSATGLTCGGLLCPFVIQGSGADALIGTVTAGPGVTTVLGLGVTVVNEDWTALGTYGCDANGSLHVEIGTKSVDVPITCTA
jgi:Ca2+-binding RTX toxin-like protein